MMERTIFEELEHIDIKSLMSFTGWAYAKVPPMTGDRIPLVMNEEKVGSCTIDGVEISWLSSSDDDRVYRVRFRCEM